MKHHEVIHLTLLVYATLKLSISDSAGYVVTHKHILPKFIHKNHYIATLSWAVKLVAPKDELVDLIEHSNTIAAGLGLINDGLQDGTADIFIFKQHGHDEHWNKLNSAFRLTQNKTVREIKAKLGNHKTGKHTAVINVIHERLEKHPAVDWYSHQVVRGRVKRAIYFEDPWYSKQWHLVRFFASVYLLFRLIIYGFDLFTQNKNYFIHYIDCSKIQVQKFHFI